MKIVATGDLHYGLYPRYDVQTRALASDICAEGADVLVLVGDIAGGPALFRECLRLFEDFGKRKLLVPGNHDLWTRRGDSFALYEDVLPGIAEECGFTYLDRRPVLIDGTAFVGTIGWYDYTLRDPRLDIDESYYEAKLYPGRVTWNDGRFIRWNFSDRAFTDHCLERLETHIKEVHGAANRLVIVTHHVPFENMIDRKRSTSWAFCNAFLGSARLGALLLRYRKITHLLCGHTHTRGRFQNGPITCLKVGASYRKKTFTVVSL